MCVTHYDLRISALKHSWSGSLVLAGKQKADKCSPRVEVSRKYGRWKNVIRSTVVMRVSSTTFLLLLLTRRKRSNSHCSFVIFITYVRVRRDKSSSLSYKSELTSFRVLRWAIKTSGRHLHLWRRAYSRREREARRTVNVAARNKFHGIKKGDGVSSCPPGKYRGPIKTFRVLRSEFIST